MKAITLYQPWATLVMFYDKDVENRSWHIRHRGELIIHAGLQMDEGALQKYGPIYGFTKLELPRGCTLGIVKAIDGFRNLPGINEREPSIWHEEGQYGLYFSQSPDDKRPFPEPVKKRGYQKLWNIEDIEVVRMMNGAA